MKCFDVRFKLWQNLVEISKLTKKGCICLIRVEENQFYGLDPLFIMPSFFYNDLAKGINYGKC